MSIFKSLHQRCAYLESLGVFYAGLGGTFGAYREARTAFENAKTKKIYARVELTEADFINFEYGFNGFQKLRIAAQLELKRAQKQMDDILREVDLLGVSVNSAKHYSELENKS